MARKKHSSSSRKDRPRRPSGATPARDPSDDQAVALLSQEARQYEWERVRDGGEPILEQKERERSAHGIINNGREGRRSRRDQEKQQQQQQQAPMRKSNSYGRFVGGRGTDEHPPIEASIDANSVGLVSAITNPSCLASMYETASVAASEEKYDFDGNGEDQAQKPLLGGGKSRGKSGKYSSRKETPPNSRSRDKNGTRSNGNDKNGNSSALSMRKNGKRPWFASGGSYTKTQNNSNGRAFGIQKTGTGVQYRSATSTQRALEELKRKRLETQEKRRAVSILAVLFVLAAMVHYGGGGTGFFGGSSDESLRGSKDKEYGDTKEVGYGGERAGASAAVAAAPGEGGEPGDYEYKIPPPQEKTYDEEHQFLYPLRHFADLKDPIRDTDTSYFFHVPRAGGSTLKAILGKCLKLVQSNEVGVRDGHGTDPTLTIVEVQESKYVNVDTTTIPGIQRAVDLGLANSGMANIVVSSYLHESAALFDLHHQGRAFILLRDPVERATSMYWHRIKELGDLESSVTIEDYAQGNGIENNWMCRFLADRMTGELTKEDLEQAKEILKDKFLVGFLDDLGESVARIIKYNGWTFEEDETDKMMQEDCINDLTSVEGGLNANPTEYEIPKRGSQAHALIAWQTQFDSKLYAYAKELFDIQTKEWGTKERKKALKKEKKKKGG
mmetsp:Transcript_34410/g.58355  ORF Transcript_34410/g.58355 Transcript_34410/m.58355 type:complete len:670 (+) Transcript_34410:33-2042(+)|eukprot:CAMPEP_0183729864 /NCGR_PEP_ID=MMETSP0737-20130205/31392_1 /TAXON_ID=385413 /ORGANISM="Thalassiosira miniscula, Strain CCMP1093" /LENGTH=669 /DNA_ID=CAMNT_0025962175 /DNA_START=55 /DNA_END=2064 /DNA_ORIENTATION=-